MNTPETTLPYRWAIKSVLLFGFGVLLIAAISIALKQIAFLRGEAPVTIPESERL